jgi:hypothetical protein
MSESVPTTKRPREDEDGEGATGEPPAKKSRSDDGPVVVVTPPRFRSLVVLIDEDMSAHAVYTVEGDREGRAEFEALLRTADLAAVKRNEPFIRPLLALIPPDEDDESADDIKSNKGKILCAQMRELIPKWNLTQTSESLDFGPMPWIQGIDSCLFVAGPY